MKTVYPLQTKFAGGINIIYFLFEALFTLNSVDPDEMPHLILVATVYKSSGLGVSRIQKVKANC